MPDTEDMTEDRDERIERLEEHLAHQDRMIAELNETVAAQWTEIERLSLRLKALALRVEAVEERPQGAASAEPPPPHY